MLNGGRPILRPETVALFTRRESAPAGTSRALGWDTPSAPSQSGKYFGPRSFGHLGYTGTSLWIDPDRQLSITLLTNRTWPDCANQAIKQVRPKFHDAIIEALNITPTSGRRLVRKAARIIKLVCSVSSQTTSKGARLDPNPQTRNPISAASSPNKSYPPPPISTACPPSKSSASSTTKTPPSPPPSAAPCRRSPAPSTWSPPALRHGGRLIYVGAGTSGRLGALDASEIPPTFNTDPRTVQFIMAGGPKALADSTEASEDDTAPAIAEMKKRKPGKHDIVLGIATSGRTPFTIAAIEYARRRGAHTIALTCNRNSPLERAADFAIVTEVGPEVLAGSSRMKAGTAHKMVLNMISTGAMTRLGYVYGNLMVNVWTKNEKLIQRAIRIVEQATGADHDTASRSAESQRQIAPRSPS